MGLHADWPYAGATAAVGNAKSLVEVDVSDIRAEIAGPAQSDHGVHVGAIEIDLTAVGMHDIASVANARFEYAVG